ncbi:hypothetical protein BDFB_008835 [Asbolus verrucosus]|uniref:DUF3421 domain containing protein n=1 Tax=Asbolus verrucosus TaxID=1661398 RepID=A0A482V0A1_ASBVE|nr:hypothetical protein BDFB_008835 [Asbolus verrucosus]
MSKCVCSCPCSCNYPPNDCYWRDYTGVIPQDALSGGKDINGKDVYIGQAYIHQYGIFVVQIFPEITEVDVPCYGVKKTDKLIKILCTLHKERFSWTKINAQTYHVDTIDKHAVIGGYDHRVPNKGVLHIGRVMHDGVLKIGEISAYSTSDVRLFFPHKDVEENTKIFEVLLYNKPECGT